MTEETKAYYARRAAEERAKAEKLPPGDPAAIAHRKLAEYYAEGPSGLRIAREGHG